MYVHVSASACAYVYYALAVPRSLEKVLEHQNWDIVCCEPPSVLWELNSVPLQEQQMLSSYLVIFPTPLWPIPFNNEWGVLVIRTQQLMNDYFNI